MMINLLKNRLNIVNLGLDNFANTIQQSGTEVTRIKWRPPANGDLNSGLSLARIVNDSRIEAANKKAFSLYNLADPVLENVDAAINCLPNMDKKTLLHAGPPIDWEQMGGPMKGAIVGAILYEGWAKSKKRAMEIAGSGELNFEPNHHYGAVGPMAGIISPSMPLWVVRNLQNQRLSFSNINEGLGKVLRFGANSNDVIERLKWIQMSLAEVIKVALELRGGISLKPLIAQALHMGDECHNRNVAATALFIKELIPSILISKMPTTDVVKSVEFLSRNDHFFLNLSMAACKGMLDAASGVEGSSMVTAMARNGVNFGIRLSGTGKEWFCTKSRTADGLFFPGYTQKDAAPDLGDSAIAETAGIGGFAMASAPAIVQFVGGSPTKAIAYTNEMANITLGRNSAFTLPILNFVGIPAGIDARKVVDTGIEPVINTGIAHKRAGIGQIGAGIAYAPMSVFSKAIMALEKRLNTIEKR